jgi:hypothetical protein
METLKLVNKSFAGEPEYIVLQNIETNEMYEFSQITNETINDNDLSHSVIQLILNNGHSVQAEINEGQVTLHF